MSKYKQSRMGPVAQKTLLLLGAGAALLLSQRPGYQFKILKSLNKEWKKINQRSLREAIRRLYQSQLIDYKESKDGTVELILSDEGKKKSLRYNLDEMTLRKSIRWDGLWRMVIFDIPEHKKQARDALSAKMKSLGLKAIQKSVFVYPYDCKEEIQFISEIFEVWHYVRFIIAKDVDIALDLRDHFNLK